MLSREGRNSRRYKVEKEKKEVEPAPSGWLQAGAKRCLPYKNGSPEGRPRHLDDGNALPWRVQRFSHHGSHVIAVLAGVIS